MLHIGRALNYQSVECESHTLPIGYHLAHVTIWKGSRSYYKHDQIIKQPVPNSKSISVLGNSKSKSYFVFQYWASLKRSLTILTSHGQDLGNTCRLIPKSEPTSQVKKFWVKISNSKNFLTRHDVHINRKPASRQNAPSGPPDTTQNKVI